MNIFNIIALKAVTYKCETWSPRGKYSGGHAEGNLCDSIDNKAFRQLSGVLDIIMPREKVKSTR